MTVVLSGARAGQLRDVVLEAHQLKQVSGLMDGPLERAVHSLDDEEGLGLLMAELAEDDLEQLDGVKHLGRGGACSHDGGGGGRGELEGDHSPDVV